MPTYEYRCQECKQEFEQTQSVKEDPIKTCPKCGKDSAQRLISSGNFILRGGGWYADGYSGGGKDS
jgi:putative FmdB family regulatory protein